MRSRLGSDARINWVETEAGQVNHRNVRGGQTSDDTGLFQLQLQGFIQIFGGLDLMFQDGVLCGAFVQVEGFRFCFSKLACNKLSVLAAADILFLVALGKIVQF